MTLSFSAWKEGLVCYVPSLLLGAVLVLMAARGHRWAWVGAVFFVAAGLFELYFFRDPARRIPDREGDVVSPADGKVVAIEHLDDTPHYNGPCERISIFLSIFDVHVNRAPYAGKVVAIRYKEGAFKNAMKAETSECNESNTVWLNTERGPLTVRQISGAVARRIVCKAQEGGRLARGEKFGMIKFGSRTELYLPPGTEVLVQVKDKVRAGSTVVARFP